MKAATHIDELQYSWIINAFQVAVMMQPIIGYVLDRIGLRIGMAVLATVWSLANMAHGFANTWQMVAGLRAVMGFAEGSSNPAGYEDGVAVVSRQ